MEGSHHDSAEDDEGDGGVVVLREVDDLVEPEGEEAPSQDGAEEDALGAEAVAQVAAENLQSGCLRLDIELLSSFIVISVLFKSTVAQLYIMRLS